MANFTVFGGDSTPKTLNANEEGVIGTNGNLITSGTAITGGGDATVTILGSTISTNGTGYRSTTDGFDLITVGENAFLSGRTAALDIDKLSGNFYLYNYGVVTNTFSDAVDFTGSGIARILNTGTITAFGNAISSSLDTASFRLNNSGTIQSVSQTTISTNTTGADVIVNSGNIANVSPVVSAINAGNGVTTILNTGEISGSVSMRNGNDTFNGINGLQTEIYGGNDDDMIMGGISQEELYGGFDDDVLFGNGGADSFYGGSGDDTMRGGADEDEFFGGSGVDWVYYNNSNAGVSVDLTTGGGFGGFAEDDNYDDVENILGSQFNDEINGDSADNYFAGGNGNDIMRGANGNDTFRGDAGADIMNGGSGFDTLLYSASNGAVNINLTLGTASGGHATGDRYFNMERVTGSQYGDTLTGSTIGNQINGLGGDDIIRGYLGNDLMNGGGGADTFIFDNNGGNDIIVGFENDIDKLDLSVYNYASAAQVLANTTVSGADVFITFDANDSIRLVGFAPNIGDLSDDLIL